MPTTCDNCGGLRGGDAEYLNMLSEGYRCECAHCERCDSVTENEPLDSTVLCNHCTEVMAVPFHQRAAFDIFEPQVAS